MRMITLMMIVPAFNLACTPSGGSNADKNTQGKIELVKSEPKHHTTTDSIPDFLSIAKGVSTAYRGFLQGVDKSDSSGPYVFKEYYSAPLSFRLIFVHKKADKNVVNFDSVSAAEANGYFDYLCFSFVYPMQDPDRMNDYHALNVSFPVWVHGYVKSHGKWKSVSQERVSSLTALSQYEIKCIYSIARGQ